MSHRLLGRIRLRRSPQVTMPRTDRQLAQILRKQGFDVEIPPKPKKRDNEESRIQRALVSWFDANCSKWGLKPKALFKISNEGMRSPALGRSMKEEGLRSGVADLFLAVPMRGHHGMFLELKKSNGIVSDEQREFLADMHAAGFQTRVAYDTKSAMNYISEYLTA